MEIPITAQAAHSSLIRSARSKGFRPPRPFLVLPLAVKHFDARKCFERCPCRLSALRSRFERQDLALLSVVVRGGSGRRRERDRGLTGVRALLPVVLTAVRAPAAASTATATPRRVLQRRDGRERREPARRDQIPRHVRTRHRLRLCPMEARRNRVKVGRPP